MYKFMKEREPSNDFACLSYHLVLFQLQPSTSRRDSLGLSFLICKMGVITIVSRARQ